MRLAIAAFTALSACVPAPDTPGAVTAYNGNTVTIRGAGDYSLANAGKGFEPTAAMTAQAQEVCPGAKFVSSEGLADSTFRADYLFICP